MNSKFKYIALIIIGLISIWLLNTKYTSNTSKRNHKLLDYNIEIETIKVGNGWGYDISINDKRTIHQTHIPSTNGIKPFKTEEDAYKTAALVKKKINNQIFPPSITKRELDSLNITL